MTPDALKAQIKVVITIHDKSNVALAVDELVKLLPWLTDERRRSGELMNVQARISTRHVYVARVEIKERP